MGLQEPAKQIIHLFGDRKISVLFLRQKGQTNVVNVVFADGPHGRRLLHPVMIDFAAKNRGKIILRLPGGKGGGQSKGEKAVFVWLCIWKKFKNESVLLTLVAMAFVGDQKDGRVVF